MKRLLIGLLLTASVGAQTVPVTGSLVLNGVSVPFTGTIPAPAAGPQGPMGPQGPVGPQGPPGVSSSGGSSGSSSSSSSSSSGGSSSSSSGGAGSSSGSSSSGGGSSSSSGGAVYIYQNCQQWPLWSQFLNFGGSGYTLCDKTHPEAGHVGALGILQGTAWQPAASGYGTGPWGTDISPYTWLTFDVYMPNGGDKLAMEWHYLGGVGTGTADALTPVYIVVHNVPGVPSAFASGGWSNFRIPLAFGGQLGQHAVYKFWISDMVGNPIDWDNVGLVPGSYSWIIDGGAVSGWSAGAWTHDAATPINGWVDASGANYSASPGTDPVTKNVLASGLNGFINPGQGITSTKVLSFTGSWKVTNKGFSVGSLQYFTFGALQNGYAHTVQFYDTSGNAVGTALNPAAYSDGDNGGTDGPSWHVYVIPLTAFGALPATLGGVSISDAAGQTDQLTAVGFFN